MKQNHAIEIIKKISCSLLVLSAILWVAACSQHDDGYELPPASLEPNVTLEVRIPKVKTPATYGLTTAQENKVNEATVLAYESINGSEQLTQSIPVTAANITSDAMGNTKIKAIIPGGEYNRLVLIANANTEAAKLIPNSTVSGLNTLEYIHDTGKWDTTTPDFIPMSGELVAESLNGFKIKQDVPKIIGTIMLTRMLAQIDVRSTVRYSDFLLREVYLYNMKRNGRIVMNGNYSTTPAQPNLPNTLQSATSPITHTGRGALNSEIYVFESEAPTTATLGTTSPRIVIKGVHRSNMECYYPVDFTYSGDKAGTAQGDFMPIVRNHRYIITVTKVEGIGFATAEEALACTDVFTNIEARIVVIDDDFTDVYHDRNNLLAINIPNTNIIMGKAAYKKKMNDNTITVLTDADNFTIECYNKDGSPTTSIKPDQTSYAGGAKTDAYLIADYETTGMDTNEFDGYMIVKAGELQSEKIPVYKVWCGILGLPIVNTVGENVYKTHRYLTSTSGTMECWMVENSREGVGSSKGYGLDWEGNSIDYISSYGSPESLGQVNGYYYTWEQRNNACPPGWSVPTSDQFKKLVKLHYGTGSNDVTSFWWRGEKGNTNGAFAGFRAEVYDETSSPKYYWTGWSWSYAGPLGYWWESSTSYIFSNNVGWGVSRDIVPDNTLWCSVRCVKN